MLKKVITIMLLIVCVFSLSSCSSKTEASPDVFQSSMEEQGMEVYDITYQYVGEAYKHIEKVLIAQNSESDYSIEYYLNVDENYARSLYNNNKSSIVALEPKTSSHIETNGYCKYEAIESGQWYMLEQIGSTFIYIHCDKEYKSEVKTLLKSIGY